MNFHFPDPRVFVATALALLLVWAIHSFGRRYIEGHIRDPRERYSRRKLLATSLIAGTTLALIVIWSSKLPHTSTFLGLLGAGLAIALKDPYLASPGVSPFSPDTCTPSAIASKSTR